MFLDFVHFRKTGFATYVMIAQKYYSSTETMILVKWSTDNALLWNELFFVKLQYRAILDKS